MTTTPAVNFCQSFKKYKAEYNPELVAFVRDWARAKPGAKLYEDASLVKITADETTINTLRTDVAAKFPGWTPVGIEGADDKKKK